MHQRRGFLLGLGALSLSLLSVNAEAAPRVDYILTVDYPGGAPSLTALVVGFKTSVEQFRLSHRGVTILGEVEVELLNSKNEWLGRGNYPAKEIFEQADYSCLQRMTSSQNVEIYQVISLVARFSAVRS